MRLVSSILFASFLAAAGCSQQDTDSTERETQNDDVGGSEDGDEVDPCDAGPHDDGTDEGSTDDEGGTDDEGSEDDDQPDVD